MPRDSQEQDAELSDLWSCRQNLDQRSWARLYAIVTGILIRYCPRELAGLREDREVYVNEFFQDKVLRLDLLSRCDHAGALRLYYQRYLRDRLDSIKNRGKWEVSDSHDDDEDHESLVANAAEPLAETLGYLDAIKVAGFAPGDIEASARRWLAASEEWVRLYVALANCPDADRSEPLVKLAKRTGIKSQAYKAEKLGFNWKNTGDYQGFAETLLGRWIVSLGIEIRPDNIPLILGVLNILCFEALSWAEQQGPSR